MSKLCPDALLAYTMFGAVMPLQKCKILFLFFLGGGGGGGAKSCYCSIADLFKYLLWQKGYFITLWKY